jgi:PAS domain S-box-containing protein
LKKVLLIDDDRRFLQATARVLLTHGYRVEEASDGLEGLQMALQDPPDVVVVDLIMPRVGGAELVSFFRQNPYLAGVPIILLSGVLIEGAAVVEELSVDFVLSKGPFEETMRLLLSGLDEVGNGARSRKAAITPRPGIHERRQVVELLNIKRDLASVLEGAAAGILEMDTKGRVTYANAGAEDLLGIGRASLIGTDILSVFPKAALANFQALLSHFDEDAGPTSRGMTSVVDDRALRTILTSVWKEDMRQSIVVTLFEVAHDVEAQNRPHQLLRYLSHEMRSSLLIIERYLRSLVSGSVVGQDGEASRADQVGILSFLAQETARLQRLLGEASKFHRTLRELPDISMCPVDLVSLIKDSISGITALAVPRGIDVSYRGPSLAPKIRGDHDKLVQVLYNLLLNALKFTPQGGSVWVELQVIDGEMLTTVADTGRGIPPEELKEILAQAQRPELFLSQNDKRVGLGLSISFQIVRAHRGQLSAESRVGAGSRFSFALPLEAAGTKEQGQFPYRSSAGCTDTEYVEKETT